jgi:repressor LexA
MNVIASNIRYLRKDVFEMSQNDLAHLLGKKDFTTVQKWETGLSTPPLGTFIQMADIFKVDLDDFARVDLQSPDYEIKKAKKDAEQGNSISVSVYGKIPAGVPMEMVTDIEAYIEVSLNHSSADHDYFALIIKGHSMMPKYEEGDIVLFEHQNVCSSGDECAVRVAGEEATFKKVRKFDHSIILQPLNPDFDPIQIDSQDTSLPVEVLGIAREIRRKV